MKKESPLFTFRLPKSTIVFISFIFVLVEYILALFILKEYLSHEYVGVAVYSLTFLLFLICPINVCVILVLR